MTRVEAINRLINLHYGDKSVDELEQEVKDSLSLDMTRMGEHAGLTVEKFVKMEDGINAIRLARQAMFTELMVSDLTDEELAAIVSWSDSPIGKKWGITRLELRKRVAPFWHCLSAKMGQHAAFCVHLKIHMFLTQILHTFLPHVDMDDLAHATDSILGTHPGFSSPVLSKEDVTALANKYFNLYYDETDRRVSDAVAQLLSQPTQQNQASNNSNARNGGAGAYRVCRITDLPSSSADGTSSYHDFWPEDVAGGTETK